MISVSKYCEKKNGLWSTQGFIDVLDSPNINQRYTVKETNLEQGGHILVAFEKDNRGIVIYELNGITAKEIYESDNITNETFEETSEYNRCAYGIGEFINYLLDTKLCNKRFTESTFEEFENMEFYPDELKRFVNYNKEKRVNDFPFN